jgi:hypothetical protein
LKGQALAVLALLVAGCEFDGHFASTPTLTCQRDDECPADHTCAAWGECVSHRDDVLQGAAVAPPRVRTGTTVTFDFDVDAADAPRVRFLTAAGTVVAQPPVERSDRHFTGAWVVTDDAPEGELSVLVDLKLAGGQPLLGALVGRFTIDRTPPDLVHAELAYLPDPANPLVRLGLRAAVAAATAGTQVQYSLVFAESVVAVGVSAAPASASAAPLAFSVVPAADGRSAVATALVVGGLTEGPWQGEVRFSDEVGNVRVVALPEFAVDLTPPAAPDVEADQLVIFRRALWGDALSPTQPRFTLRGRDGATEGLGVVEVYLGDLTLGRMRTDAQGAFPETTLPLYADTHDVLVRFDDLAGNASELARVRDFELAVTPNPLAGAPVNPLGVSLRPVSTVCATAAVDRPLAAATALLAPDGVTVASVPGWREPFAPSARRPGVPLESPDVLMTFDAKDQVLRIISSLPNKVQELGYGNTWAMWAGHWAGEGWLIDQHSTELSRTSSRFPGPAPRPEVQGFWDSPAQGNGLAFPFSPWDTLRTHYLGGAEPAWLNPSVCQRDRPEPARLHGQLFVHTIASDPSPPPYNPGEHWAYDPANEELVSLGTDVGAWDPRRATLVRFGGTALDGGPRDETWTYSQGWRQLTPAHRPSPRAGAAMAWDPEAERVLLLGGQQAGGAVLNEVWAWDGLDWSPADAGLPEPLTRAAAAWEPNQQVFIVAGGYRPAPDGGLTPSLDSWIREGGQWRPAETDAGSLYVAPPDYTLPVTGLGDGQLGVPAMPGPAAVHVDQTYEWFSDDVSSWQVFQLVDGLFRWGDAGTETLYWQLADGGSSTRLGPAFAFDGDEAVLFGGAGPQEDGGAVTLEDTLRWTADGGWVGVAGPHPSGALVGLFAPEDGTHRFVFHAQVPDAGGLAETWVLDETGWQLAATSGPVLRGDEALWWNPWLHQLQLLGGGLAGTASFQGNGWVSTAAPGPGPLPSLAVGYHAASGRALLVSGATALETDDGVAWTPTVVPQPLTPGARLHALSADGPLADLTLSGPVHGLDSRDVTPALQVQLRLPSPLVPGDATFTGVRLAAVAGATQRPAAGAVAVDGAELRLWFEDGWARPEAPSTRNAASAAAPGPLEWARSDRTFMWRLMGHSRTLAFEVRPPGPRGTGSSDVTLDAVEAVMSYRWRAP